MLNYELISEGEGVNLDFCSILCFAEYHHVYKHKGEWK